MDRQYAYSCISIMDGSLIQWSGVTLPEPTNWDEFSQRQVCISYVLSYSNTN